MINLTIDGKAVKVPKGTTVYKAATAMGIDLPIFCYQDRMPPFGACRVCLVEVEKMSKLQTSCTLEAAEGMVVKTQTQMAVEGRKGILEFLLINHPLDCPICDRGGECPLQEQALTFGPGMSRFFEEKRKFKKALPLGPVLMLDRERCIVCARCTRFGDIIAGDHALEFIDRGFRTEVGTPDGEPVKSKFIGNTIQICPVGALTSQVYRFRARPWDNTPTDSTCTLCPVGCSLILDSRDGEIMRTRTRENKAVNDIWMCDKGWFGYEFTYSEERLKEPLIRKGGELVPATWEEALNLIADKLKSAKKIAGFGGNPLTLEENESFQKLIRSFGSNHVDHRIGSPLFTIDEEGKAPGMEISIGECEDLTEAHLFGLNLTEEFPVIWLRLKQAINKGAKVYFYGHFKPEIAPYLTEVVIHRPGLELETIQKAKIQGAVFVGSQYLNSFNRGPILNELKKTAKTSLNILEGNGNSMGARLAGMHPEAFGMKGLNALEVLQKAAKEGWDLLWVAGANPALKFPSPLWKEARAKLDFLIVQDLFLTETANQAHVVLPTLSYVEKGGSFVNIEGRVSKLLPGKEIPEDIFSDGEIFEKIASKLGVALPKSEWQEGRLKLPEIDSKGTPIPFTPGALMATFDKLLFDHGVRMKHNPHVVELSKNPTVRLHPREALDRHLQEGPVSIRANGSTIQANLRFDEKVSHGTLVIPLGYPEILVHDLADNLFNGLSVEIRGAG